MGVVIAAFRKVDRCFPEENKSSNYCATNWDPAAL